MFGTKLCFIISMELHTKKGYIKKLSYFHSVHQGKNLGACLYVPKSMDLFRILWKVTDLVLFVKMDTQSN